MIVCFGVFVTFARRPSNGSRLSVTLSQYVSDSPTFSRNGASDSRYGFCRVRSTVAFSGGAWKIASTFGTGCPPRSNRITTDFSWKSSSTALNWIGTIDFGYASSIGWISSTTGALSGSTRISCTVGRGSVSPSSVRTRSV